MDEPTAGLDAIGRQKITDVIQEIKRAGKTTIVIVSHRMSDLVFLCTHLGVLEEGRLLAFGKKEEVLAWEVYSDSQADLLPDYIQLVRRLAQFNGNLNTRIVTMAQAEKELERFLGGIDEKS